MERAFLWDQSKNQKKGTSMKLFGTLIFMILLGGFVSAATAATKTLYVCYPVTPTDLISKVIINSYDEPGYQMIIVRLNAAGQSLSVSDKAEYHDNMTSVSYTHLTLPTKA